MKKMLNITAIRQMQIKTTVRYQYKPIKGCRKTGSLDCWRDVKWYNFFGKQLGSFKKCMKTKYATTI